MQTRSFTGQQSGVVAVWMVLLTFAFMGLLALIVDMGYARLAQLQMQNAVDGSVKEGLRGLSGPTLRRAGARDLVTLTFDDDLDPSADAMGFGAGPVVQLSVGTGDANAFQTIEGFGVYDPTLQLNFDNLPHGDMVSGRFNPAGTGVENGEYARDDFVPSPDIEGSAFLMRLRRTRDPLGFDAVDGVSTNAPPLPFLFGRGALMAGGDPSTGYSARHHGLSVRATALADVEDRGRGRPRVKAVGPTIAATALTQSVRGRTPWALRLSYWSSLPENVTRGVGIAPNGDLIDTGLVVGRHSATATSLGSVVTPALPTTIVELGYVPIFETVGGIDRVIGFGLASLVATAPPDAVPDEYLLTRLSPIVAPANATAVVDANVARLLGALGTQDPIAFEQLMQLHRQFDGALLAPVQVR